ncbi:hypothetical protein BEWA_001020 [Theileria equi strain WA]|uniref:Signal peptide-containing protein n=1 Tax=Theileria equi strain WA TaxID=1537102 RepID=L0AYQ4_THEEQ|nr:hypothetical protein BEWA_001020 [Theileria equi strain WA]AFZ80695.1 hypothetical protein BEWA_001020 [Theileria equi strain WA]|eukprot:XP_004830361.1 hypothetical protein BEWA_001020 [Theileria equi strain WA]
MNIIYIIILWYGSTAKDYRTVIFNINAPVDEKSLYLRFIDYKFFQKYSYTPRPKCRVTAVIDGSFLIWETNPDELVSKIDLDSKKIRPIFITVYTLPSVTQPSTNDHGTQIGDQEAIDGAYKIYYFMKVKNEWEPLNEEEYSQTFYATILSMEPEEVTLDISRGLEMEKICLVDKREVDTSVIEECENGKRSKTPLANPVGTGLVTINYYPRVKYSVYNVVDGREIIWNSTYDDQICTFLNVYEKDGEAVLVDLVAEDSNFLSREYFRMDVSSSPTDGCEVKKWKRIENDEYMRIIAELFECNTPGEIHVEDEKEAPKRINVQVEDVGDIFQGNVTEEKRKNKQSSGPIISSCHKSELFWVFLLPLVSCIQWS